MIYEIDDLCNTCHELNSECTCEHNDDFFEDEWDDDYCCFDPRYTGPKDYCACAEHAKEEYSKLSIFNKISLWFSNKWHNYKVANQKVKCEFCKKESKSKNWSTESNECPYCKKPNLPF